MLEFERHHFIPDHPGAWRRWYVTIQGYCREFGWRAVFLGGACE